METFLLKLLLISKRGDRRKQCAAFSKSEKLSGGMGREAPVPRKLMIKNSETLRYSIIPQRTDPVKRSVINIGDIRK